MVKVLYIEDEINLGKIVHETLKKQGFDVILVNDGAKVSQALTSFIPDICIIDIMLPNVDGYTLCRMIKARYPEIPVVFLTAKTETPDLVRGFEAGGTDYMRKPFSIEELIIRINNQLNLFKQKSKLKENNRQVKLGKYFFDPVRYELRSPMKLFKLSQREQEVLSMLTGNINQITPREMMLKAIWGDNSFFNSRTLDVYIRKIRGYFDQDKEIEIVTLKGKGYLFLIRNEKQSVS